MNEFIELNVGDKVLFENPWLTKLITVEKIGDETVVAGGMRFSTDDGIAMKGDGYISPLTEKEIQMGKQSELAERVETLVKYADFRQMSPDRLESIIRILEG